MSYSGDNVHEIRECANKKTTFYESLILIKLMYIRLYRDVPSWRHKIRKLCINIRVIFDVRFKKRKKAKYIWKLKHTNSVLESFEYFCQLSLKSILMISSYTVSKLMLCLRHSVVTSRKRCFYLPHPSAYIVGIAKWSLLIPEICFPFISDRKTDGMGQKHRGGVIFW